MGRLPQLTARDLIRGLLKAGFVEDHQRGSHRVLYNPKTRAQVVVPVHSGDVKRPLLKAIIRQAGLSEEEFTALL